MPLIKIGETSVYFVHCPKAGGSSVEDYLDKQSYEVTLLDRAWLRAWKKSEGRHRPLSSPQHMIWSEAEALLEKDPDQIFAVIRHPVARLVSEFRYQKSYRNFKWLERRLGWMSFATWLRVVGIASKLMPHLYDNHIRPQTDLMPKSGVDLFRLEDGLDPVAAYLAQIDGSPPGEMPQSLPSTDRRDAVPSRQDLRFIHWLHRNDFERFGYDPAEGAGKPPPTDHWAWARLLFALVAAPLVVFQYRRGRL
ncbi:hypothetical protein So717_42490 [Roseobacter cerasinus]|uniref:Sulfotransferase family protein n=1 Tax=Roseobacter cerasinus TaxID=2602289 RepID=A0A640W1X8_9RHOB|nr:sulfotransferase family 2 domain-containing protein [Roseobacter cerasinus]GFE52496.1 hypothetical protein So717_42490 [Roseobacter cerasinus]